MNVPPGETGKIVVPTIFDVLCGKGKLCDEHKGNIYFRNLIKTYLPAYNETRKRSVKVEIIKRIGDEISSIGGRFLKREKSNQCCKIGGSDQVTSWSVAGPRSVREKISHALREGCALLLATDLEQKNNVIASEMSQLLMMILFRRLNHVMTLTWCPAREILCTNGNQWETNNKRCKRPGLQSPLRA